MNIRLSLQYAMRMVVCGLCLGTLLPVVVQAQTLSWIRQLGTSDNDSSTGVATDSNGNVYISGSTVGSLSGSNQGFSDAWVAKYNSSGTRVWQRQLGTSDFDSSNSVATDSNGNVYISGQTGGSLSGSYQGGGDAWVAKYNSSGTREWIRQLGSSSHDSSEGVATDSNGNVYISGRTFGSLSGSSQGGYDAWVAKYNSSGILVWQRQFGSSSHDESFGVVTDSNGNVYISGRTERSLSGSNQGGYDAWVAKYNSSGTREWIRQLGTSRDDFSYGVATDSNGNVYISGVTEGSLKGSNQGGGGDAWVAKYNSSGILVWQRQFGSSSHDESFGVATDSNGNVYISGSTYGSLKGANQGRGDAWVAKYNSSGILVWQRQFGSSSDDFSYGVATDSNGNVYISGSTEGSLSGSNQGYFDAWVAKYTQLP